MNASSTIIIINNQKQSTMKKNKKSLESLKKFQINDLDKVKGGDYTSSFKYELIFGDVSGSITITIGYAIEFEIEINL